MKKKFKQAIRIENNVTDIMKLPCVFSCHKDRNNKLVYLLYDWDKNGNYIEARKGDWLCEDYDWKWHVLTDEAYEGKETIKMEGAKTFLEDLEKGMDECRKRCIEALAEEQGITIEEATQIADDISANAPDLILPNLPFKIEYPL